MGLKPRRGKRNTAESKEIVLAHGEVFFEIPKEGTGKGLGAIKMGDGATKYSNLPYFLQENPEHDNLENFIIINEGLVNILSVTFINSGINFELDFRGLLKRDIESYDNLLRIINPKYIPDRDIHFVGSNLSDNEFVNLTLNSTDSNIAINGKFETGKEIAFHLTFIK